MPEARERFWVAVSQSVKGGRDVYVSNKAAKFGTGKGKPPKQHPGWIDNFKPLGLQLTGSRDELLFTRR